jgi:uridine kinase
MNNKPEKFSPSENITHFELERKFFIPSTSLPENLDTYPVQHIQQGYLSLEPDGNEIRVRSIDSTYVQTVKSGVPPERIETEIELSSDQFYGLWPLTEGRRIEKDRFTLPEGITVDKYHGNLTGLIVAEKEFETRETMYQFTPPPWFGREITQNSDFNNKNLAEAQSLDEILKISIPEYELEEGIHVLAEAMIQKSQDTDRPIVVEIAGGSSSGKTSAVAARLKELFGDNSQIISMDDFYKGSTFMQTEAAKGNILNWDQPEAIDITKCRQFLEELKNGQIVQKPIYDFKTGEAFQTEELRPTDFIIVEGLYTLTDEMKDVGDIRAFVDIGAHGRIIRRLLRDVERTGQKPADILRYFAEVVGPMHDKYVQTTKGNADMVIKNEYNAHIEAERSGLHEAQLKFKGEIDEEVLRRNGERLGSTRQRDIYYNPADRDLSETGETLRIRSENGDFILTYKGPKTESSFRNRPKFEFKIDAETAESFIQFYGKQIKAIDKNRTFYMVHGMVLSVDDVQTIEGDIAKHLGKFIEIRAADGDSEESIAQNLSALGLSLSEGTKESYAEM